MAGRVITHDDGGPFTPGPYWCAEDKVPSEVPGQRGDDCLVWDVGAGDECLATFDRRADAMLYRASPDLLANLKAMVGLFDHCGLNGLMLAAKRHGWTKEDVDARIAACRSAHTAIAKAEGVA